jgi:GH24 family phage-related lysozyme (muramidase)
MAIDSNTARAAAAALAIAIAIPAEGIRRVAYYDPPGILTVCRGHTGPDVVKGKAYSLAECDQYLTDDMRKAIATVDRCVPGLPKEVLASFGDATFNLGGKIACDTTHSTAARFLKAGNLRAACDQLPRWDKASVAGVMVSLPGLTKRRAAERELCLQGVK